MYGRIINSTSVLIFTELTKNREMIPAFPNTQSSQSAINVRLTTQ